MRRRRVLRGWAVVAVSALAGAASGRPEPIVTTDLLKIRTVTAVDVSADGSRAVYAVRSIAAKEPEKGPGPPGDGDRPPRTEYEYRSHLFLIDLHDPEALPRPLTFGARRDDQPRISPDGRRVAFVRAEDTPGRGRREGPGADEKGGPQVWVMQLDGGEARQVTRLEHGAAAPEWSPDGRTLLVRSPMRIDELEGVPPYPAERPGRAWGDVPPATESPAPGSAGAARPDGSRDEIRAWLEENAAELDPTVITRLHFQEETALRGLMRFDHLFLVEPDAEGAAPRRITQGFFDHGDGAFMPDGRSVVYAAKKVTDRHPDRLLGTDLWRVDVDGRGDRLLLAMEGWTLARPRPGRDGSLIAFIGQQIDEPAFRQERLGVVPAEGGGAERVVWLTDERNFDASVMDYAWGAGRSSFFFKTALRGAFPLMTVSEGLLEPAAVVERRDGHAVGVGAFDAGGGSVVYAITTHANPCVLAARDPRGAERVLDDLNPWVAAKALAVPAEAWVSRPDGFNIQYWVMEPTGRIPGQKYSLVLDMHGGPAWMWGPGEPTMWHEFQLFCSWGYGVAYANPRGSTGYGYEFQRANFQDWGTGPAGDVLAALDRAALNEWVDADRLVITGGSYAGYLTAWIVAHDRRFKAAVAQRGVYDLATFFGEGNAWQLLEWSMGGHPFDARFQEIIERNSPFTYVNRIHTPLLILHASRDLRTGVSQSEMLYRALKALGRPVEYVRYPDAGHDLSRTGDPRQRMDRLDRIIEFFERHVSNPRPAPQAR